MGKIILATNNVHKFKEFKKIYSDEELLSLKDIGFFEDVEETGATFLENALIKAKAVHEYAVSKNLMYPVIADDSGLEVDALDGAPGVYSARYASEHDQKKNRDYLIKQLRGYEDKTAHFTCCLVKYFPNNEFIYAYGKTDGYIIEEETGDTSFGYDCIFYSSELNKTFGEASDEEKNGVSHRARAIKNLQEKEKN